MSENFDHSGLPDQPSTLADSIRTASTRATLLAALFAPACTSTVARVAAEPVMVDIAEVSQGKLESYDLSSCYMVSSVQSADDGYEGVYGCSEATCIAVKNGRSFHVNSRLAPLYPQRYELVGGFRDGIAKVWPNENELYILHINKRGEIIEGVFDDKEPDVESSYRGPVVAEESGQWFHRDEQGNPLYPERYKKVGPFYDGTARAVNSDGKFHINMRGKPLYSERYDKVDIFHRGMTGAMKNGRAFIIYLKGNPAGVPCDQ